MSQPVPMPVYTRATGNLLVALVGKTAYAFIPIQDGHVLGYAGAIDWPMETWRRDDFYGYGPRLADEDAFRSAVLEQYRHETELLELDRHDVPSGASTPWGGAQHTTVYAPGIRQHHCAGHGGLELDEERNRLIHEALRTAGGWYEEDFCWSAVALAFPELFTTYERQLADRYLQHLKPGAWEAIHGRALQPGESEERDRQLRRQP